MKGRETVAKQKQGTHEASGPCRTRSRRSEPIRVEAFVTVGGEEVNMDTLSPEMRKKIGTQLALTYFNELWRGKAVFSAKS